MYIGAFIVVLVVQLLLVSTLIVHRRRARQAKSNLAEQLRFETLLTDLSARFVKVPPSQVDQEIEAALRRVMDFFDVDRCGLVGVRPEHRHAWVIHASYGEGIESVSPDINLTTLFPWSYETLVVQGQYTSVPRMSELPPEAERDRQSYAEMGTLSALAIPVFTCESVRHLIVIHGVRKERDWTEEYATRLRLLGEIFVRALERKRREEELQESEMRLSLAADSANAGLWAMNLDTCIIWGTKKAMDLCGLAPDDLLSFERFLGIVHPGDRDRIVDTVEQATLTGQHLGVEYRLVLPDGSIRWVSSLGRFHYDESGRPVRLMGASIDITEKKRDERLIRESEEFNRAVLASLKNHFAILDRDGNILSVNRAWELFALENGVSSLANLGPGVNYLEVCRRAVGQNDEFAKQALEGIQSVMDGGMETYALEYPCDSPSESRWFLMKVMPFKRAGGGVVISHTNITERKNAELEARLHREELAHFSRIVTVSELATSLAHEINQPITAILWNAQAARRFLSAPAPDLDEVREILNDIIKDDQRAGEVIRRMRNLVRKGAPRWERVNLNETVQEVISFVRTTSSLDGLLIVTELSSTPPAVRGDHVQLQQVILNLVLNAIDAMKEPRHKSRKLRVVTAVENDLATRVSISDSGVGIEVTDIDRLFEPFFTTKPGGLGMGLSISQTIIKAHGGTIGAENNPSKGATFFFVLPLYRGDPL